MTTNLDVPSGKEFKSLFQMVLKDCSFRSEEKFSEIPKIDGFAKDHRGPVSDCLLGHRPLLIDD